MKTAVPVLPTATTLYDKGYQDRFNRILTLFFNELVAIGPLEGTTLKLNAITPASTLAHAVTDTATTFELVDATLFPDTGAGTIGLEKFTWAAKSGNTLTGIMRGQFGTTAVQHSHNTVVIASVEKGVVYAHPTTAVLMVLGTVQV